MSQSGILLLNPIVEPEFIHPVPADREVIDEEPTAKQMPTPVGYKMLIALPKLPAEYDNGIVKADVTIRNDEMSTVVGFVVSQGPDCYKDGSKFPTGPWCKEGDFVLIRAYSGTRFKLHGEEMRMLNDDGIEGVVSDPRGYQRI